MTMNATNFSSELNIVAGIGFVATDVRVRFKKVRSFLTNPDWRVSKVAFEVGFHSSAQFSLSIRNIGGEPPSKYRSDAI